MNKRDKNQRFFQSNFLEKNRKGTEKVVSVYWFAIIVIIAGGVFAMAYSYYNSPYDVRGIEGDILSNKIADCISVQGRINENLYTHDGNFSILSEEGFLNACGIILNVEKENDWNKTPQYFYEVNFYNVTDMEESAAEIKGGNLNYRADCFIEKESGKDYKRLVKCTEKRFYSVSVSGKQYLIKILVGVGKSEKNVKL